MKKSLFVLYIAIAMISNVGCSLDLNLNNTKPVKIPEISEEAIAGSAQVIKMYGEIKDAEVTVENKKVNFYLVTRDEKLSKERLRELAVVFMKALSGYMVNDELKGPTDESYGQIYDYYDVEIIIEGDRGSVLDKGTKGKGESEIQWQY